MQAVNPGRSASPRHVDFARIEQVLDALVGSALAERFIGGNGDDRLEGRGGNDFIDGGAGIDTAVFGLGRASYDVRGAGASLTVFGLGETVALVDIERLRFSDRSFAMDLSPGEAAANTVRIIGAAFDAPAIAQHPDWVGIGLNFFDSGQTFAQVCDLVAGILALTDGTFVDTLYANVVGSAPDAGTHAALLRLLHSGGGPMSQGDLLQFAATHPLNDINIDLVGLQISGVAFVS